MFLGLTALGANATETVDGIIIQGKEYLNGGVSVNSFNDHRTAMSLAVASVAAKAEVIINGTECVTTSYPEYFNTLETITH